MVTETEVKDTEEETETEIPGEGEDGFDEFDWEEEGKKKGYKSLLLENLRKGKKSRKQDEKIAEQDRKIADLESKEKLRLSQLSTSKPTDEELENYKKEMIDLGYDDKFINTQIKLVEKLSEKKASKLNDERFKDTEEYLYQSAQDSSLNRLAERDDETSENVKTFRKEIKETMKKMFAPKFWGKEEVALIAYGLVMAGNVNKLKKKTEKKPIEDEIPNEPDSVPSSSSKGEGGITDKMIKDYCIKNGLDETNPETKKHIRTVLSAKARIEKQQSK